MTEPVRIPTNSYMAVRALIVDSGLVGRRVMRPPAQEGTSLPYVEIDDSSPSSPVLSGDGTTLIESRAYDVSVWQKRGRDRDPELGKNVAKALRGRRVVVTANGEVYSGVVRGVTTQWLDDPEIGVGRDLVTVVVHCSPLAP